MTSSSPSIFPAVGGTVAADASSPAVAAPRHDAPGLRFDDYCPDDSAAQGQGQPAGKKDAPSIGTPHAGTEALDLDKPVEDSSGIEPVPEAAIDVAVASEEANPLVIAISRADLRNPTKLLAAIAAAIASQSGTGAPRELLLVLQPAGGTQSADAATKTISVPLVAEEARPPGRSPGRAMAATIAAVVQAALSYAKTLGVAPTRDAPEPASVKSVATSRASTGKPSAAPAVPASVVEGEKPAASKLNPVAAVQEVGNENFLTTASQSLVRVSVRAGIDGALQGESMKSVPRQHQNSVAAHHADLRGGTASGVSAAAVENTFNAWKSWTNTSGEQTATAARFSQVSERIAGLMANQAAPATSAPPANVAAASAAPVVPVFPVSEAALLGPLGNALERMILRGQDQLSLTIRFEQGGSLALRLALRNGEIKTDIRTDVAGLENALRSAWSTFAQDWSGRGVKLAAPVFSTNPESTPDQQQQPTAHRDGRNGSESGEAASRFPGQSHLGGALRNSRGRPAAPVALDQSSRSHEHGLHVWA